MKDISNHREFNEYMNKLANTQNVQYSPMWDLNVTSGEEYMNTNYHNVAKIYAKELLKNAVDSTFHDYNGKLSKIQKATLQHMARTTTIPEFEHALHLCMASRSMNGHANQLFSKKREPLSEPLPQHFASPQLSPQHFSSPQIPPQRMQSPELPPQRLQSPNLPLVQAMQAMTENIEPMAVDHVEDKLPSSRRRTLALADRDSPISLSVKRRKKK